MDKDNIFSYQELTEDDYTKPGQRIPADAGPLEFAAYNLAHFNPLSEDNLIGFGSAAGAIRNVGGKAAKLAMEGKVPFKIKANDGSYDLKSPAGEGTVSQSSLDHMHDYDPALTKFNPNNPYVIEHIRSNEPGYGTKILKKLEEKALKEQADAIYLNASPMDEKKDLSRLIKFYERQGFNVVNNEGQNAIMYKKLAKPSGNYADGGQVGMDQINVVSPEGEIGSIPAADLPKYQQAGFTQAAPEAVHDYFQQQEFGTPSQQVVTGAEAALRGAIPFGGATALETKVLGVNPERIKEREEANPVISGVSEAGGLLGSMFVPGGQGKVLTKIGNVGAKAVGLGEATGTAAKIGSMAVKGAIENGVYQSGNEVHKMFLNDPNQTLGTAAADMGLMGLMGGAIGGGFGAVSPLWKATQGSKLNQFLELVQKRSNGESIITPDIELAIQNAGMKVTPEVKAALSQNPEIARQFNILRESQTTPGIDLKKALGSFEKDASDTVLTSLGKRAEDVPVLSNISEYEAGKEIQNKLVSSIKSEIEPLSQQFKEFENLTKDVKLNDLQKGKLSEDIAKIITSERLDIYPGTPQAKLVNQFLEGATKVETMQDLKKSISLINDATNGFAKSDMWNVGKQLKNAFRDAQDGLTEAALGAKAPEVMERYQATREGYRKAMGLVDDVDSRLRLGQYGGPEGAMTAIRDMAPEDILKRLGSKGDVELTNLLSTKFPEIAQNIRDYQLNKLIAQAALKAPEGQAINAKTLFTAIDKLSPEQRAFLLPPGADQKISSIRQILDAIPDYRSSFTARHADNLWGKVPGAAAGMAGALLGHGVGDSFTKGGIGYLIGQAGRFLARDMPDAIRLGFLRFLGKEGPVNASAFKYAVDMAAATIKGESLLSKSVKSLFKTGSMELPKYTLPSEKDRKKLDAMVSHYAADNSKIIDDLNGDHSYYMESHAPAISETLVKTVNYLSQIKPKTDKMGLDEDVVPSDMEKAKYERALNIAQQPLTVLENIKNKTLVPEDVITLKTIYPGLYQRMSEKIMNEIVDQETDGNKIDYGTRLNLAMFLAQPLDSTMQPQAIAMNQASHAPVNQAESQQGGPASKGPHSYKALNKLPNQYLTPTQARNLGKVNNSIS